MVWSNIQINIKNKTIAFKAAFPFLLFTIPAAIPTQNTGDKFIKMLKTEFFNIVPNSKIFSIFAKGIALFVSKTPKASKIPTIGNINTGINIPLENSSPNLVLLQISIVLF